MNRPVTFLQYARKIGALEFIPEGRKLKSGRISPYFFNSGLFNTGDSLSWLAAAYADVISFAQPPDVIFGPAYKGIPLSVAVALSVGGDVGYAFNRKEAKDHGEGGIIIGMPVKGKVVDLVDDVMTTGESLAEGIDIVLKAGGTPRRCVISFDRQERASDTSSLSAVQEFENKHGIPVQPAVALDDLIELLQSEQDTSILSKILEYKDKYGV